MEELYTLLYGNEYENHSASLFLGEAIKVLGNLADIDEELGLYTKMLKIFKFYLMIWQEI